jgi:hypothetical protein
MDVVGKEGCCPNDRQCLLGFGTFSSSRLIDASYRF